MASMQCYKPADHETCQQNPSLGQKVAQMIGLAPKPSHHHEQPAGYAVAGSQCCGQSPAYTSDCGTAKTHSDHQGMTHPNSHGHDASSGMACHGKTEKKMKGKKSEHKEKRLTRKSKGRDGKSRSGSDSSSNSDSD